MVRKLGRRGFAVLAGTMVVAGPVAAACAQGATYDQWAATDGAAGRINLDEVQEAFKESESVTDFERKVNEVYEGDGMILVRASQNGDDLLLEGFEDLNGNGSIDDDADDVLFEITKQGEQHNLQGRGANGYYNQGFGGGNFLFTYMLLSSMNRGPYFYNTSPARVGTIRANRTNYRNSSGYRSQVSKNTSYFNRQKSFDSSKYSSAGRNLSQGRTSYQTSNKATGSFKTSGTGVRSSWGSTSASSRRTSSGFRGGGGTQAVIGFQRRRAC